MHIKYKIKYKNSALGSDTTNVAEEYVEKINKATTKEELKEPYNSSVDRMLRSFGNSVRKIWDMIKEKWNVMFPNKKEDVQTESGDTITGLKPEKMPEDDFTNKFYFKNPKNYKEYLKPEIEITEDKHLQDDKGDYTFDPEKYFVLRVPTSKDHNQRFFYLQHAKIYTINEWVNHTPGRHDKLKMSTEEAIKIEKERLNELVNTGVIKQDEADKALKEFEEKIESKKPWGIGDDYKRYDAEGIKVPFTKFKIPFVDIDYHEYKYYIVRKSTQEEIQEFNGASSSSKS